MNASPSPTPTSTRVTRQRLALLQLLGELTDFRSAQEIHAELRTRGTTVGLATVYRTLSHLAADGAVDTLVSADGEARYRKCSQVHHHHLVCRACGRTVEIAGPAVEKWAAAVAAEHGFTDVSHELELFGLCAECSTQ